MPDDITEVVLRTSDAAYIGCSEGLLELYSRFVALIIAPSYAQALTLRAFS